MCIRDRHEGHSRNPMHWSVSPVTYARMKIQGVYETSKKKHRCWLFLRHCLAWFCTLGYFYWSAAEPLANVRGTPVENHWPTDSRQNSRSRSKLIRNGGKNFKLNTQWLTSTRNDTDVLCCSNIKDTYMWYTKEHCMRYRCDIKTAVCHLRVSEWQLAAFREGKMAPSLLVFQQY